VIALAITLKATIEVSPRTPDETRVLELQVPQMNQTYRYDLNDLPPKQTSMENADFALAAIHEAIQDGWKIPCGATCVSTTDIVMQAGCSSSTAFTIAWILVLAKLAGKEQELAEDPLKLSQLAHKAEVVHFGAPGGTMDHVSIALGGTCLRIGPEMWEVERLKMLGPEDGVWILADSGDVKDTFGHLKRCKGDRLALLEELGGSWDVDVSEMNLNEDQTELLKATLTNRETEAKAVTLWRSAAETRDGSVGEKLGALMLCHHQALRDGLKLSTPKLEAMCEAAMKAGAWGYKLVGSGGGGCAVAWAPRNLADDVAAGMKGVGAKTTWTINMPSPGARIEI
jgi:galactokinase